MRRRGSLCLVAAVMDQIESEGGIQMMRSMMIGIGLELPENCKPICHHVGVEC